MSAEVSSMQRAGRGTIAAVGLISLLEYPFPLEIFQKHTPPQATYLFMAVGGGGKMISPEFLSVPAVGHYTASPCQSVPSHEVRGFHPLCAPGMVCWPSRPVQQGQLMKDIVSSVPYFTYSISPHARPPKEFRNIPNS